MAAKVAFLADERHYRRRPRAVATIETHFAWVFLVGNRAYKLKKPLRQAPVDYRTLARRERACRAELELNRRLAPHVYLRVVPLGRDDSGELTRAPGTRVVDWLVEMVRLPATRMLDRAILTGTVGPRDLERVVARLATFFRRARRRPLSERGYLARLRRKILTNARELRAPDLALDRSLVEEVIQSQLAFLGERASLLAGRGERLIDGHGDLRPEHIFLGTRSRGACVIDCLEFDTDLRRLDPAEEVAFLALECGRLGAAGLADDLIAQYARAMGDSVPQTLIHFYMSRCAAIRAQIAAWHLRDAALAGASRKWRARAHSYLADALQHIRCARALPGGTSHPKDRQHPRARALPGRNSRHEAQVDATDA
ncbi:MAG TPA: phosphotransferase [Steroidobacteraceae bacterium]|nr:phosphotransferase [Steroidobacteraceae bacterium]